MIGYGSRSAASRCGTQARRCTSARRTASSAATCCRAPQANPSTVGHDRPRARTRRGGRGARGNEGWRARAATSRRRAISTGAGASRAGRRPTRSCGSPCRRRRAGRRRSRRTHSRAGASNGSRPSPTRRSRACRNAISADQQQVDAIDRQQRGSSDATAKAVFALRLGDVLEDQLQAKQLLSRRRKSSGRRCSPVRRR